jgi:hypothetical protein
MSRMSASGPVAGDGLRMGSGEPAEFPTSVKEVVAMFGDHISVAPYFFGGIALLACDDRPSIPSARGADSWTCTAPRRG